MAKLTPDIMKSQRIVELTLRINCMTHDPDYYCCENCCFWFLKWDKGNILCPECFYDLHKFVFINGTHEWIKKQDQDD
jgi:hypothetical protein